MTELTDEEAKALLAECDNPDCLTCEYARALLDARAELDRVKAIAAAAQAMVVERCAEEADRRYAAGDMGNPGHHIRALAPADGLAMVRELRDRAEKAEADRDRLAAANAVLEAKVAGLVGADVWYRLTWTAAPRPPAHPTAMTGRQNFDTLEKATAFFKRLASDAEFVSMTKFVMVQLDVSDEARAALATQEAGNA